MKQVIVASGVVLMTLVCRAAMGGMWYVDGTVSASGNGRSWLFAFKTIQEGIDASSDGDTVMVAEATYYENIEFPSWEIVLRSKNPENSSVVKKTIIDGNRSGSTVTLGWWQTEASVLEGFTIQHGEADWGAGVYALYSWAQIRNNLIVNNTATLSGGGIEGSRGIISDNTIHGNVAGANGGGLSYCSGTIRGNLIKRNSASGMGGGLNDCDGTIEQNTITLNSAAFGGGLSQCDEMIRDNAITENEADPWAGGGLWRCNGLIWRNTITSNSATDNGGGLCECEGTVLNNIIADNTATDGGGLSECDRVLSNLIIGNVAEKHGGGVYGTSFPRILNNTIVRNSAGVMGGGVHGEFFHFAAYNCIISDNTAPVHAEAYMEGDPWYCCIPGWPGGDETTITLDPQFVNLEGPDGDPATWKDNNYRLKWSSPCVDSGTETSLRPPGLDMDGNLRVAYGRDAFQVDMGAYEFYSAPLRANTIGLECGRTGLTWVSQPNDTYTLWSRESLVSGRWSLEGTIASHGPSTMWLDTGPPVSQRFYRIEMSLE